MISEMFRALAKTGRNEVGMLKIENLSVTIEKKDVLKDVSFDIGDGEIVGVVGESGCGKTMTALGIMGLLPSGAQVMSGKITFNGEELLQKPQEQMRKLRGNDISMIFQEPMTSLNPTMKIGKQLTEVLDIHPEAGVRGDSSETDRQIVLEALESVGLADAQRVFESYPHELSGGMRQRAMIAMAVLLRPWLLIADEPTTALDVVVQKQILELLVELNQKKSGHPMSILFITHDLELAKNFCEHIVVMKDGRIVEQGKTAAVMENPSHEYTKKLIDAVPKRIAKNDTAHDRGISPILKVDNLTAYYKEKKRGIFAKSTFRTAVDNVSFEVWQGESLGLVGESGCGKTSLSKAVLGINRNVKGNIIMNCDLPRIIFQDPYSSLNPAYTIGWLLEEPLLASGVKSKCERRERALSMLEMIGLGSGFYDRYPAQLSGGQRQRVSIGQALITNPKLVIADEPVSALDVTIQAQIIELMLKVQEQMGLAYIFISHDMNVIYRMCGRVMVMQNGRIVEYGDTREIFEMPKTEYTKQLLEAAWK